jgi:hypothetical protein
MERRQTLVRTGTPPNRSSRTPCEDRPVARGSDGPEPDKRNVLVGQVPADEVEELAQAADHRRRRGGVAGGDAGSVRLDQGAVLGAGAEKVGKGDRSDTQGIGQPHARAGWRACRSRLRGR